MTNELQSLQEENQKLRDEVRRLRAAFALGIGRVRPVGEGISVLEARFPHVAARLVAQWGARELNAYLQGLLMDERGDRQGFPFDALQEIQFLQELHLSRFQERVDWTDNFLR